MLSDHNRTVSSYQQLLLLPAPPSVRLPADSRQHPASSRWRVDVMEQREGRVFTVWRTRRATTQRQSDGKKHREGGRGGRTRQLFTTQRCWCAVGVWCGVGVGEEMGALRDWSQTGPQSRELGGLDRFDWPQAPLCLSPRCSCMFTAGFVHTAAFKCGKKLDHQRKNGKTMSSVVVFIIITTLRRRLCIHILTIYQMKRKQLKTNRKAKNSKLNQYITNLFSRFRDQMFHHKKGWFVCFHDQCLRLF